MNTKLDLRFLEKGLQDYRQVKDGYAFNSWQDLIRSSMRHVLTAETAHNMTKKERIENEFEAIRKAI